MQADRQRASQHHKAVLFRYLGSFIEKGKLSDARFLALDTVKCLLFVTDSEQNMIKMFEYDFVKEQWAFCKQWGGRGTNNYQFSYPAGVAVSEKHERVFVVDYNNNRVQAYSYKVDFLFSIGASATTVTSTTTNNNATFASSASSTSSLSCSSLSSSFMAPSSSSCSSSNCSSSAKSSAALKQPWTLCVDDEHDLICICDCAHHRVVIAKTTNGELVKIIGPTYKACLNYHSLGSSPCCSASSSPFSSLSSAPLLSSSSSSSSSSFFSSSSSSSSSSSDFTFTNMQLEWPINVAVDGTRDLLYISEPDRTSAGLIRVFDIPSGVCLYSFGEKARQTSQQTALLQSYMKQGSVLRPVLMHPHKLEKPYGLISDPDHGLLFVLDGLRLSGQHRVVVYQHDGTFVNEFLGGDCFSEPSGGIALWRDHLFVLNPHNIISLCLTFNSDYLRVTP